MPLDVPARYQLQRHSAQTFIFDHELLPKCKPDHFESDYWKSKNSIVGQAQGRGTTWFLRHGALKMCLRHYRRGGLVGRFIRDSYLFLGFKRTRLAREFALLAEMHTKGLPVPRPVAGRVVQAGLLYRADLLIETIDGATDLVGLLSQKPLTADTWQRIGQLVSRFHRAGIWHADLNAHNILCDADDKLWLIDFDRGERRKPSPRWQQANLDRLLRSFNKERNRLPTFHFDEQRDWSQFMAGYLLNH